MNRKALPQASRVRPARRTLKVSLLVSVGLVVLLAAAAYGYKLLYSMDPAPAFEVGQRGQRPAVLVATQGSAYKDAVVRSFVERLKRRVAYVRVVDVSALPSVGERDWDALAVLHTWESRQPQPDARAFVGRVTDRSKLVVLTTSGSGDEKMPAVDAITSASEVARAHADATELFRRTERVLDGRAPARP
jgi:hypothetical protein